MKKASVIIPTCNRPFLLKNLIGQLKPQLKADDEIVVVNDGDPGNVPNFDSDQIEVVEHCKPYYAIASAQNAGIHKAIGDGNEWGCFIDDDCEVNEGWLDTHRSAWDDKETLYSGLRWDPRSPEGVDVRAGKRWNPAARPDVAEEEREMPLPKSEMPVAVQLMMALLNCSVHLPSLKAVGGIDEDFDGEWGYEDTELSYRLLIENDWGLEYLEDAVLENRMAPPSSDYNRDMNNNKELLKKKLPNSIIREVFGWDPLGVEQ